LSLTANSHAAFRFHHLVDWLESIKPKHEISAYIINQFNNFLKNRVIAMEAVSWELVAGLRSFKSLIDMIQEALAGNNIQIHQRSAGWNWHGYYLEKAKLFVGVYFDKPNMVVFDTEVTSKINDAESLKFGRLDGDRWYNELDLESEEIHFFARSKASQIQCLEKFIKENFEYAITLVE
jgi:putative methionine-R-sulfoxide reductase with GAF domain